MAIPYDGAHGMRKDQILAMQKLMKKAGVYNGPLSGTWNGWTQNSLKKYQRKFKLPVTGRYDAATDLWVRDTLAKYKAVQKPVKGLDRKTKKFITENYGYLTIYLHDPEIGPILIKAAKGGWDEARLEGKLRETKWWKAKSASERAWQNEVWTDPATAMRKRMAQEERVWDTAHSMGLSLVRPRVNTIVENSLKYGWSEGQLTDALIYQAQTQGNIGAMGSIGTDMRRVDAAAAAYMLTLDPQEAQDYAIKIARGHTAIEDVQSSFSARAAKQYSHLADQINSGLTMNDLFSEHKRQIANTLELDEDSVDLNSPDWSDVISLDDNGTTRMMTVGEAKLKARKTEGFQRTQAGRDSAGQVAMMIGQEFGYQE